MAVTYGFYNSLNKDRMYNAEQMSSIFNGIITDGVFSTVGDALMTVAGSGMQVVVKTGRAWFNSTWTLNDALLPLDIPTADVSLTRIDAVILEVNSAIATRTNSIKVLKGTASANPTKPTLSSTETLHQYALAYVTVVAGATSITASNIEVNVGKTGCPFITSVLQQTDITDLFNQWEAEFDAWFANVQSQLAGDVAANLQRQIDENYANTLKDSTKTLLGLSQSAVPDDAFLCLIVGSGFYGYRIKVLLSNGEPAEGVKIEGLMALNGTDLYTDADGIGFGKSAEPSINVSLVSPFIDQKVPASKTIQSIGVITDETFYLTAVTELLTFNSSQTIKCSPASVDANLCAVGGGGGAGGYAYDWKNHFSYGSGGGGGYATNLLNYVVKNSDLILVIGAGGRGGASTNGTNNTQYVDGVDGGTSTITKSGNVICEASGGKGALSNASLSNSNGTKASYGNPGGVGNGNGGQAIDRNDFYRGELDLAKGKDATTYIFDDSALGLAGGGGGGAGIGYNSSYQNEYASGGSPNGGMGLSYATGWNDPHYENPKVPGGGGAGYGDKSNSPNSQGNVTYGNGASGCIYIQFHFA